jgi:hypothetical protein
MGHPVTRETKGRRRAILTGGRNMTGFKKNALQKFVQDAKIATYLKYMDSFSDDDKIKWLDILYALREDINRNIQRLEKYNK